MRTLISEVLLPASAAVGLLAMLTIPPATAEDRAPQPTTTASLSVTSVALASAQQAKPSRTPTDRSDKPAIEPRCERIERIGKFAITRCQ
jgi:hypothetical protein